MNIFQHRYLFDEHSTLSRLYLNGTFECYILEDRVREPYTNQDKTYEHIPTEQWKIPSETAIPVGKFDVTIDMSSRFKKLMIHILEVPGFSGIRCHSGNTNHDTEGCMITGKERNEKLGEVSGSILAKNALFSKIQKALDRKEKVTWEAYGLIPPNVDLPYRDKSVLKLM